MSIGRSPSNPPAGYHYNSADGKYVMNIGWFEILLVVVVFGTFHLFVFFNNLQKAPGFDGWRDAGENNALQEYQEVLLHTHNTYSPAAGVYCEVVLPATIVNDGKRWFKNSILRTMTYKVHVIIPDGTSYWVSTSDIKPYDPSRLDGCN